MAGWDDIISRPSGPEGQVERLVARGMDRERARMLVLGEDAWTAYISAYGVPGADESPERRRREAPLTRHGSR